LRRLENATSKVVIVGLHRQSQPDSQHAFIIGVARHIPSPRYRLPHNRSNDIMLIELSHPVVFNEAVSPICLPAGTQTIASNTRCYATGWGKLHHRKCIVSKFAVGHVVVGLTGEYLDLLWSFVMHRRSVCV
jgi:Trypsin